MVAAGYWPSLHVPRCVALEYSLARLNSWMLDAFYPILDGEDVEGIGPLRSLQMRQLWAWCLDNVQRAGQATRESVMYSARRALKSAGIEPRDEEELKRLSNELFRGNSQDRPLVYMSKGEGQWRVSWRHLRDNSPILRRLRYRHRKEAPRPLEPGRSPCRWRRPISRQHRVGP